MRPDFSSDLAHCHEMLAAGSKSFSLASRILPRRVREPATVLYAFCRDADDAVDEPGARAGAVDELRERLDRVYRGRPLDAPVDRALACVVAKTELPRAPLDALLEGMEWDVRGRSYETLDDLHGYAARVAGTVGVAMTVLMGPRAPSVLARACDLGVAMQLTNIARDVGEDARRGRVYLPLAWLREAGVDPERLVRDPRPSPELASVVSRLLEAAEGLYTRADEGIGHLPRDCRVAIRAARLVYSEIGARVARAGFDAISQRAVVPRLRKLVLLARATGSLFWSAPPLVAPALPPVRFLVRAVSA